MRSVFLYTLYTRILTFVVPFLIFNLDSCLMCKEAKTLFCRNKLMNSLESIRTENVSNIERLVSYTGFYILAGICSYILFHNTPCMHCITMA
jgi:hypothetical protein